jgi:rare lipoprotein A
MDNNDSRRARALCAAAILAVIAAPWCRAEDTAASIQVRDPVQQRGPLPNTQLANTQQNRDAEKVKHHEPDFSGRKRLGKASFYAKQFAGKPMASGVPMNPQGDNAASKTLPLGTVAKVTNLETGRSAVVTIQDRGPYVPGRIVDLSPATARQIGITAHKGIARVEVAPIAVPQPDGKIKLGEAVHELLLASASSASSTARPNP